VVYSCQLRASGNGASAHGGGGGEALFPLRATTTAADSKRDGASSSKKGAALFWGHEPTGTSAHRLRRTRRPGLDSPRNCSVELVTVMAAGAYAPYAHRSR